MPREASARIEFNPREVIGRAKPTPAQSRHRHHWGRQNLQASVPVVDVLANYVHPQNENPSDEFCGNQQVKASAAPFWRAYVCTLQLFRC
jgi:hypothetical protein